MSTRATIQFKDKYDTFYVYRHCDGFPDIIEPDIHRVIEMSKERWSGSECGLLVSMFIGHHHSDDSRLPDYEITSAFHGDESYKYYVMWNESRGEWILASQGQKEPNNE